MKQRELARYKKISIGVFDDKNFYVADIAKVKDNDSAHFGEEILRNMHYFTTVDRALIHAVREVAVDNSKTLEEYIAVLRKSTNDLLELCAVAKPAQKEVKSGTGVDPEPF